MDRNVKRSNQKSYNELIYASTRPNTVANRATTESARRVAALFGFEAVALAADEVFEVAAGVVLVAEGVGPI
jgi:hypothetical protein